MHITDKINRFYRQHTSRCNAALLLIWLVVNLALTDHVLQKTMETELSFRTPKAEEAYYLRISIQTGWLPPAINSRLIRVNIRR